MALRPNRSSASLRYEFGSNWRNFIDHQLNRERIESSRRSLLTLLGLESLDGRAFLDIGCGSGLHSLAAWQSGAKQVTSFDADAESVEATRRLHALAGSPSNWTVMHGDVLDPRFLRTLSPHEVVYSWGVLHHTGAMWDAVQNASRLVPENGLFCVALYTSDAYWKPSADFWIAVKQRYNSAGEFTRASMEWWYFWRFIGLGELRSLRNPFRLFREYGGSRGMALWTDIRDWLGGWPMEFAGIMETRAFCQNELGLTLEWMTAGEACTEYLFVKKKEEPGVGQPGAERRVVKLPGPFTRRKGFAFSCPLPEELLAESGESGQGSSWVLFEDEAPLTFPRANLRAIEEMGKGRSRRRGELLYFSTSDGTAPGENGREYTFRQRRALHIQPPMRDVSIP